MRKNLRLENTEFKGYTEFKDINVVENCPAPKYKLDVYIRKLQKCNGDITIEIRVKQKFGEKELFSQPIEVHADKMVGGLRKLNSRGLRLTQVDINKIRVLIDDNWFDLPIKQAEMNLGFNADGKDVECFVGACTVGTDGKFYKNDEFVNLPRLEGSLDLDLLERVLENKKRRLIMLHGLTAPLVGLAVVHGKNQYSPILTIVGESRTGKTVMTRFVESMCVNLGYREAVLDFNATRASLLEIVKGNKGIPVLIDDTSLADMKGFKDIYYKLSDQNGYSRCVLGRDGVRVEMNETHGTSILMTAESNPLYCVDPDLLGVNGRVCTLELESRTDLFEDVNLINDMERSMECNSGVLLPMLVKWLFKNKLNEADTFRDMVDEEMWNVKRVIGESDGIVNGWLPYFSYMSIMAKALKDVTGIDTDIDEIIKYMVSTIKNNVKEQRCNTTVNLVVNELYPKLVQLEKLDERGKAENMCRKNGNLYITSDKLKKEANAFISENKLTGSHLKIIGIMRSKNLLKMASTNEWSKNIGGAYGRCYCLAELTVMNNAA